MIDPKIIEKLAHLDDATILRRLPDSERTFFEYVKNFIKKKARKASY